MSIRAMRWWDLAAVGSLEQQLFPEPWSTDQFLGELAHVPDTRWYVVAEDQLGLTGYAGLRAVPPDADVQTLAVAPRAQRAGVGGVLLDALLAAAEERACTQVFLEVRRDNVAAQALYESRGFELMSVRRGYYGSGEDAVVMRRSRLPEREGALG